jgi:hypothetical protein
MTERRSPQEQARGQVKYHSRSWSDMPQTIILSLDQGPGEKGKTKKRAPLSSQKMTFHFSAIMATLRLLNIDAKKWSMPRRLEPINP